TPETHDLIRGAGSHDAVIEAVAVARERGIPVWIQLTLNRRNIDDVEGFCVQAARMGVTGLRFEGTQATGTLLDPSLFVSAERMLEARDEIERLASRLKLQVPISPGVPSRQRFVMCAPFEAAALYVEPDGQVRFCAKHAGVPSPPDAEDHIGKIGEVSLLQAQIRMFAVIRLAQERRLELLKSGDLSGWNAPQCNTCLAAFGRPFWTDAGRASGAQAKRERWRGAWVPSPEKAAEAEAALLATESPGA
ncbi:MAG: MoaA/NifB/PqqE/SkfB family radical SAM enzyme, partial [Flavobacteriales bacterium]